MSQLKTEQGILGGVLVAFSVLHILSGIDEVDGRTIFGYDVVEDYGIAREKINDHVLDHYFSALVCFGIGAFFVHRAFRRV